ncbi:MAG TPA: DNA repair protein RadA [Ornithinimicrobium sp.]|uniref:DNA repair protein RadA n=1 Tax=Ornithinimicrobium sp. TaxID=1977084 RepID=UPI002B484D8B|nr:DNA repair protein RadA [Ornithinimicrobium sp.]HKJ12090.1 DNA repair protein RadA [Ornithinimicrobium sp.]
MPAASRAASAKSSPAYVCTECGWRGVKWVGRCPECQAWGSVSEQAAQTGPRTAPRPPASAAVPIDQVSAEPARARSTGVAEFDRVLGSGLVPGATVLMAGEPGTGKSTLALDVAARAARGGARALYVSAEESAAQVRLRAERTGALTAGLLVAAETDLAAVLGHLERVQPDVLVVDSVQTVASAEVEGAPGHVGQVREVASALVRATTTRGVCTLLIGHVTKDGSIAGPRTLEHLVDVVMQFEGDRHARLRLLRAVKNRFGPTDEVGCFDLGGAGIVGLADPSSLFLTSRDAPVPGTCVSVTLEGRRPLLAEVQALLGPGGAGSARRTTSGVDSARLAMVLAVLQRRAGLDVTGADCYVSTVGGVRLTEPAADLAVALAVAGATVDRALPLGTVACGEVGLAGELRPVSGVHRRLVEAARMGFRHAVVPTGSLRETPAQADIQVTEAATVAEAAAAAFDPSAAPSAPGRGRNGHGHEPRRLAGSRGRIGP